MNEEKQLSELHENLLKKPQKPVAVVDVEYNFDTY